MSFLWRGRRRAILKKPQKESSPTNQPFATGPAQGAKAKRRLFSLERISLPASLHRKTAAGMTVEAAVVLPLVLFFLLSLGCIIESIRLHGNLQLALWSEGSRLAVHGGMGMDGAGGALFSFVSLENGIREFLGEEYLEHSPLAEGASGLHFLESSWVTDRDELDIVLTYSVSLWGGLGKLSSFNMRNRYFGHLWSGYEIPPDGQDSDEGQEIVYVAENGQVYHTDRNCTHLELKIRPVSGAEVESQRNLRGETYSPCEKCQPENTGQTLYITEEGNRYHADQNCSGLKRTVFSVWKSRAVKRYRACSRCG